MLFALKVVESKQLLPFVRIAQPNGEFLGRIRSAKFENYVALVILAEFRIVVLVADGTDMARGRSRIPQLMERDPVVGDMHRFSASAISRVDITAGDNKPVRITVAMENVTGLFQVEEVLMAKVKASPIIDCLEICAIVDEEPPRFYLS